MDAGAGGAGGFTTRFRTTPPVAPTVRTWWRSASYSLEEQCGLRFLAASGGPVFYELPLELVPDIVAILGKDDDVLGFVTRYGPLGAWWDDFDRLNLGALPGAARGLIAARKRLHPGPAYSYGEFVDELLLAAGAVQSLVACRQELDRPRFVASRLERCWPKSTSPWAVPETRGRARYLLVEGINLGLQGISLGIAAVKDETAADAVALLMRPDLPLAATLDVGAPLYSLVALELADALLDGRAYRTCTNEACGRLFTMQAGRSRYGGHRSDAEYCSRTCARAQAQREYRRRQRAAGPSKEVAMRGSIRKRGANSCQVRVSERMSKPNGRKP